MSRLIFILIILLNLFGSCARTMEKENNDLQSYMQEFYKALNSNDKDVIESELLYLEQIKSAGKVKIASLDYNIAQLLFKLKKFDKALAVLRESREATSRFYEITLLLRLGNTEEAFKKIDIELAINKNQLNQSTNLIEKKKILSSMALLLNLSQKNPEILYTDLAQYGLKKSDIESDVERGKVDSSTLLKNLWPE